ncbi:sulfite exporter TauE/SafE family protein [Rhodoblastus sp.]|uniref:sulfite exporter TauE/SafE family protein n=1 Tax=Rhodoblastus sp. TaxID=1962975 RepID=UPI003F9D5390
MDSAALLSGVIVGFVLGLIGGGGSIFATPLLYYFVGVADPHIAIGTGAAAVSANALANLLSHARAGRVRWKFAVVFAIAGVIGAFVGASLGKIVDGQKLLLLFGVLMLVVAGQMAFKRAAPAGDDVRLPVKNFTKTLPALLVIGTIVGILSGFFGIGGGFLVVPGILAATGMPMINAIASSLVSVAAFGAATAGSYAWSGLVDWRVAVLLLGGGVVGGLFGARLAGLLAGRRRLLTQIFAAAVAGVGLYVIARGALALMKA